MIFINNRGLFPYRYTAEDIMKSPVIINNTDTVEKAIKTMKKSNCNVLCVKEYNRINGYINYEDISKIPEYSSISNVIKPCSVSVIKKSSMNLIIKLIEDENAVFVMEKGICVGVITKETLYADGFIQ